ncbi:hypothetical protein KR222_005088 [Zaprionus bogoriensis]|nr:hypothetical protein KR222_005088 [Zaprionus bogoriensis]
MAQPNCIFCDISAGKTDTVLELETEEFVIFKDIRPATRYHYLIVPKQHYESLKVLDKSHKRLVSRMQDELMRFLDSKGCSTDDTLLGFHLPPFISVKHLHMHGIAPRSEMSFLSRMVYRPSSLWFKTVRSSAEYVSPFPLPPHFMFF